MPLDDLAALRIRHRQSTELAAETGDASVRIVHQKMADDCADRIAMLALKPSQ